MRVQVAGGRGFIGTAVVHALRPTGVELEVTGRAPQALEPVETLVWCAGARDAGEQLWSAHVRDACATVRDAPALRAVVYLSSGEVYGAQAVPFRETAPRLGRSAYAAAKIAAEDALTALCAERGLALTVLRPALVYGPTQTGAMLIPSAIEHLCAHRPLELTAGEQTRDWVHVDDVARAVVRCVTEPVPGLYNLGSGQELGLRDALALLAAAVGPDAHQLLRWGALPYRPQEQLRYALDATAAAQHLRWTAKVPFADGVAGCVRAGRARAAVTGASA